MVVLLVALPLVQAQKTERKKEAALKKELASSYRIWLEQDVAYIMTDEERRAFLELGNDDEREQFVEQFWLRRDPTPETAENEYKEEHYRRIAYANDHFASGIPGWKTDRGRIYIRFGPPDDIEAHPSGGTYQRASAQGGGSSSAYPFEIWRYRHLNGVGEDIHVEFVDPTMSGEYHLTIDPCEKDALTFVPNAGLTQAEQSGLSTKQARFQNTDGTHCGAPLGAKPESDNEFTRLSTLVNLGRAPSVGFRDLEAELITSHVNYDALPMQVRVDYLRVTDASVLANVTVEFELADRARINLLGHVYTLSHRRSASFEKTLEAEGQSAPRAVWQSSIPLSPGRYKLELIAKDTVSGSMVRQSIALDVPHFSEGELAASSLILADSISRLPVNQIGGTLFAIGDTKVRPRVSARFTQAEKLGIYFEVYNAAGDGSIRYEISEKQSGRRVVEFTEEFRGAERVRKLLPLRDYAPGEYALKIDVSAGGHTVERSDKFTVAAGR